MDVLPDGSVSVPSVLSSAKIPENVSPKKRPRAGASWRADSRTLPIPANALGGIQGSRS
jgi:hypothetical protein